MGSVRRAAWVAAGFIFTALAFIGLPLPLVPTTPLALLALFCFGKSSPAFHRWMLNNKWLGPHLTDWYETRGIRASVKAVAVLMVTIWVGASVYYFSFPALVDAVLVVIAIGVITYIVTRPTPRLAEEVDMVRSFFNRAKRFWDWRICRVHPICPVVTLGIVVIVLYAIT